MMKSNMVPSPAYVASLAPKDAEDAKRLVARVPAGATAVEFRMDLAERPILILFEQGAEPSAMLRCVHQCA